MKNGRPPRVSAMLPIAGFLLFLAGLFWYRSVAIILPLSQEIDCGHCLFGLQAIGAWPLFGAMLTLFAVGLAARRAWLRVSLRLFLLALVALYLLDIYVYRNFFVRLDVRDMVVYGDQFGLIWNQFLQSLTTVEKILVFGVAALGLLFSLRPWPSEPRVGARTVLATVAVMAAGLIVNLHHDTDQSFPNTWVTRNVVAHNLRTGVSEAYAEEHLARLAERLSAIEPSCLPGHGARPNIVLLLAESWSPYHSALFSGLNDWTPRLDGWAEQGRYFSNLHAGGSNTNAGLISILLGHDFYSPVHGPLALSAYQGMWGLSTTLPRMMAANGYRTVFMTNGNLAFSGKGEWLADLGFEEIHGHDSPEYEGLPRQSFDAPADEHLYRKALAFAERAHERPYLLVVENVSTHHPYTHPHSLERGERKVFEYMDRSMHEYLRRLGERDFFRDNLLLAISDHRAMTMIDGEERALFGLAAGSRIPGFALSGLIEAGKDDRPLHQSDLLPSLAAMVSGEVCGRRPLVDMLGDGPAPERCLYHAPNSDWHTIQAYCPDGEAVVRLAGSRSTMTPPGLRDPEADRRVLEQVAMRRTLLDSHALEVTSRRIDDSTILAGTSAPSRPAIPRIDAVERRWSPRTLPPAAIDPDGLPQAYACNVEFLNARSMVEEDVEIDGFADFAISGWVVDAERHDNAPDARLLIVAEDGSGRWVAPGLRRTERPDVVAAHAERRAYLRSGFTALLPIDAFSPGDYRAIVVYRNPEETVACGAMRRFRLLGASSEGTSSAAGR